MPVPPSSTFSVMSDTGTSGGGALAATLALAKVLGLKSETALGNTKYVFPENSRVPISEVERLPTPRRRKRSARKPRISSGVLVEKYDQTDDSIPQLITDSIPIVHDRLPDPNMWERLKLGPEVDIQEIIDISKNPRQTSVDEDLVTTEKDVMQHQAVHNLTKRNISSELEGLTRRRQLYCRNGYHLEILPDGTVQGTRQDHSRYGILAFVAIRAGQVTIRGVETGLYLAMDSKGRLYGSKQIDSNCFFHEKFLDNHYNTYSSTRHRNNSKNRDCFVAITQQGRARPGCRSKKSQKFTHFLPRIVDRSKVKWQYEGEDY